MESPRIICIGENGKKIDEADFRYGFALYKIAGKREFYFKNKKGRFSQEYYINATPYKNGFAEVEMKNGESKFRNIFGEISSFRTMEGRLAASIYDLIYQENFTRTDVEELFTSRFFVKELAFAERVFIQTIKRMNGYFQNQTEKDFERFASRILIIKEEGVKIIEQKTKEFSEGENEET